MTRWREGVESGCGRDPRNYGHCRFPGFPEIRDIVNDTNSSRISGEKNNPKSGANEPTVQSGSTVLSNSVLNSVVH